MARLVVVASLIGILFAGVLAAQDAFSLGGRLSATDQEAQEGYFAVDQETMIVVKPNSQMHAYLKGKVGQRVRITVEPLGEAE